MVSFLETARRFLKSELVGTGRVSPARAISIGTTVACGAHGTRRLNHTVSVTGGILAAECGGILTDYFAAQRKLGKK